MADPLALTAVSLLVGMRSARQIAAVGGPLLRPAIAAAAIFIGCFFLGTNFNYRMIFLLLPAAWLLAPVFAQPSAAGRRRSDEYALAAVTIACWSYPVAHWLGQLGLRGAWGVHELGAWSGLAGCGYTVGRGLLQLKPSPLG